MKGVAQLMAWERRRNGRLYYYLKERNGKKVRSWYVGRGPGAEQLARQAAQMIKKKALEREHSRFEFRNLRAELDTLDTSVKSFETALRPYVEIFMIANGFHFHRGQWRRKTK